MNSGNVRTGSDGFTVSTNWLTATVVTGVRSRRVSSGILYRCGLMVIWLSASRPSVWPSGAALATRSVAMLPLAPARFSTTTGWPMFSDSFAATRRAAMSGAPPGGMGTRMVIGRWASAAVENRASKTIARIFMSSPETW
jgi:hypothetical protein